MKDLLSTSFFSYSGFSKDEIAGMFTRAHLAYILIFFSMVAVALFLCRNISAKTEKRIRLCVAIAIVTMEIVKIGLRLRSGMGPETWLPLYFCGLFNLASVASVIPFDPIARCGKSFIATGGIVAGIVFCLYPTTSLVFFPALHIASVHSFVYHSLMIFSGILLAWKGDYKIRARDGINYLILVCVVCVPSLIVNEIKGTNFMFLRHPEGIPILRDISSAAPVLYTVLAIVAQGIVLFYALYGLYKLSQRKKK